jgi:hypothetical protein
MADIRSLHPDPEDEHWFAILTGHEAPEAHPDTVQDAERLRQAILAEAASTPAAEADQVGLDALLGRLRTEGLLTSPLPWWRRPQRWSTLAAAALVLCALPWLWHVLIPPEPTSVIKHVQMPQLLYAPRPVEYTQALQAALRAHGVTARHKAQGPGQLLTASLPQPLPEAVQAVLTHYGLTVPTDDKLVVTIQPTEEK